MLVIKRNAYFLHHENILLAMICEDSATIRRLAWKRIAMKARNQARGRRGNVRFFAIPDLKLDAPSYFQVVDWPVWSSDEDEPDNVADPPILIDLTDEEDESFAENKAPKNISSHLYHATHKLLSGMPSCCQKHQRKHLWLSR